MSDLHETLRTIVDIRSEIGDEGGLCTALEERMLAVWGPGGVSRIGNSIVVGKRTGRPIVNMVSSVTVLHRSCMMADGWATALTVLGPKAAIELADAQQLAVCVIAGEREFLSREWRAMLD